MSLMKLAPETVRLRRVAKAYAAGEFSRYEYRAARREVIENFRPDCLGDDDTQRRSLDPSVAAVDIGARSSRRPWLWGAMALLLVAKPVWLVVLYAVVGALFMPLLAALLLIMNNHSGWMGADRNGRASNLALLFALLLFITLLVNKLIELA